jgi:hypothetical protein
LSHFVTVTSSTPSPNLGTNTFVGIIKLQLIVGG